MEAASYYIFAADLLLVGHALFVAFVVFGLLLILAGGLLSWSWVRNPWFRWIHLGAIGVVVVQSWLGIVCPLTTWEMALRERAGDAVYSGSFISHWLGTLLYYRAPGWVFALVYTIFAGLVVAAWFRVRPHRFGRRAAGASPQARRTDLTIRNYSPDRADEIADLYHRAVHAIDPAVYPAAQQEAWAPTPPDYGSWSRRLASKQPFMAVIDGRVAGFIELEVDGHIDCLYTHPDFQGQGVASALYAHLVREARVRGVTRLYVEASLVAKPFFERRGFSVLHRNEVERNGVRLVNFSMQRLM